MTLIKTKFATVPPDEAPAGEIEYHPFADAFPLMTDPVLAEFALNLRVRGQNRAIILFQGKILDGRNRFRACRLNEAQPHFEQFLGTEEEALDFVESENLHRRDLSVSQRAMSAARIANLRSGVKKTVAKFTGDTQNCVPQSQADAAKRFRVSQRSVSSATKVLKKGIPELIEQVEAGTMTLGKAVVVTSLSPVKQKQFINRGRQISDNVLKRLRADSLKSIQKFKGDFYISPDFDFSDTDKISALLQCLQEASNVFAKEHKTVNYSGIFGDAIFELEETKLSKQKLSDSEMILMVIDRGTKEGEAGIAEQSDIIRIGRLTKERFEMAIMDLIEHNVIEAVKMGGKHENARGGRKNLFTRVKKVEVLPKKAPKSTEPPDIYYGDFSQL